MKRRDFGLLVTTGLLAAIVSMFVSHLVFQTSSRSAEVPMVPVINTSFPDVKNDPNYSLFLNKKAIDPTQPIELGNSKNSNPFR